MLKEKSGREPSKCNPQRQPLRAELKEQLAKSAELGEHGREQQMERERSPGRVLEDSVSLVGSRSGAGGDAAVPSAASCSSVCSAEIPPAGVLGHGLPVVLACLGILPGGGIVDSSAFEPLPVLLFLGRAHSFLRREAQHLCGRP